MKRRAWVTAGLAGTAAAAGAGFGWWRNQQQAAADTPPLAGAGDAFWPLRFEQPQGGELAALELRGRRLLVNFWATWCPPCVEELPLLDRFQREQQSRGWQVLALAIDRAEPVREFLAKRSLQLTFAMGGPQGFELIRQLGNSAGGLPFSVVFDTQARLVHRKLGAVSEQDLASWAANTA